ncbi:MAG: hypothetical protein ABIN58_10775, partial [candidate division WOR-3 bacterium]
CQLFTAPRNSAFRDAAPKYANFFKKVFGSDFDVDAFTVDIPHDRHMQISPSITQRWKDFIDEVEGLKGAGRLSQRRLQGMTLAKMQDIAKEFKYDHLLDTVRCYGKGGTAGESLDELLRLGKNAGINLTKNRRWLRLVASAVKKGSRTAGAIMTAWAVANFASNPKAAIASELGISEQSVEDLFEGKMGLRFSIGKPGTSVSHAVLRDGSIIFKGQDLVRHRWNEDLKRWESFDITVKDIRTTETWGKYQVFWGENEKEAFELSAIAGTGPPEE